MANLISSLGYMGSAARGADDMYSALQARQRAQEQADLQRAEITQSMRMRDQQWALQQSELFRRENAARMAMGMMPGMGGGGGGGGPPQNVGMPGATPMPGGQPPQQQGQPQLGPTPQMTPIPRPPQGQPQGGAQASPTDGLSGGGISIAQIVDHIKSANPNADPLTVYEALQNYQAMMKPQDAQIYKNLQLQLAEMRLQLSADRERRAGDAPKVTASRELRNLALQHGVDVTGKTDEQIEKEVSTATGKEKALTSARTTAGERRTESAKKDVDGLTKQALAIIKQHPNAVGVWAAGDVLAAKAAGVVGYDAPENAEAATQLQVILGKLADRAGVADAGSGTGGTQFAKRYEQILGSKKLFNTSQLLAAALEANVGDLSKSLPADPSIGAAPEGVSDEIWAAMAPERRALWKPKG